MPDDCPSNERLVELLRCYEPDGRLGALAARRETELLMALPALLDELLRRRAADEPLRPIVADADDWLQYLIMQCKAAALNTDDVRQLDPTDCRKLVELLMDLLRRRAAHAERRGKYRVGMLAASEPAEDIWQVGLQICTPQHNWCWLVTERIGGKEMARQTAERAAADLGLAAPEVTP